MPSTGLAPNQLTSTLPPLSPEQLRVGPQHLDKHGPGVLVQEGVHTPLSPLKPVLCWTPLPTLSLPSLHPYSPEQLGVSLRHLHKHGPGVLVEEGVRQYAPLPLRGDGVRQDDRGTGEVRQLRVTQVADARQHKV